jgi:hypothetical protein
MLLRRRVVGGLAGGLVLALAAAAGAGTIGTALAFVGAPSEITCNVVNLGPKPVTIRGVRFLGDPGVATLQGDTCSGSLAPGGSCGFGYVADTGALGGAADVKGSGKTLRGLCFLEGNENLYLEMR